MANVCAARRLLLLDRTKTGSLRSHPQRSASLIPRLDVVISARPFGSLVQRPLQHLSSVRATFRIIAVFRCCIRRGNSSNGSADDDLPSSLLASLLRFISLAHSPSSRIAASSSSPAQRAALEAPIFLLTLEYSFFTGCHCQFALSRVPVATVQSRLVPILGHPTSASSHPTASFLLELFSLPLSLSRRSSSSYASSSHRWSPHRSAASGTWAAAHLCPLVHEHRMDWQLGQRSLKSDPG